MRENPLFTAQLMLNFSRSKLWRSNAIIIFSTTNTVFLDNRSLLLMSKKLRSFRKRNPAKERKKDKRRLHEEKGEKSHKDLYVSYHTMDELSLAANIFSITANFTSLHCSNYHDVQKITILPQTESRKGKEKKQIFCLPHWARSLHPQDSRLLDIEFLMVRSLFLLFNSSILTSLHMTKIITQKKSSTSSFSNHQKNHHNNTNCWVSGSQIRQENAVEEVRKQTKGEEWRDGLAEKGAGNVQLNPGKNGGRRGGSPGAPARPPAQAGYLTST